MIDVKRKINVMEIHKCRSFRILMKSSMVWSSNLKMLTRKYDEGSKMLLKEHGSTSELMSGFRIYNYTITFIIIFRTPISNVRFEM